MGLWWAKENGNWRNVFLLLAAESFQGEHKKYVIFLEIKFAYFSRIFAFLQNQRLAIPKVNFANAEFDSDWQLASWLQPQGIGVGKERKRNCLGESGCRKRKKNHDVIQCTFTAKEGSDDISWGGLKGEHWRTKKNLGFKTWRQEMTVSESWSRKIRA